MGHTTVFINPVLVSLTFLKGVHQPRDISVLAEVDDPDHNHCQVSDGVGGERESVDVTVHNT